MVDTYKKVESHWPAGEDHRVALATSLGRMPTPKRYLRCAVLRSPGVTERRSGPLGLRGDDEMCIFHN